MHREDASSLYPSITSINGVQTIPNAMEWSQLPNANADANANDANAKMVMPARQPCTYMLW